jgi:hypothetical protein
MRLSRIRLLGSLFPLLALLSAAVGLCLRSVWLVSPLFDGNHHQHYNHDENNAAESAFARFHHEQQHHSEWRSDAAATLNLTFLLKKQAKEIDALRRENQQQHDQQQEQLLIANLTVTIQQQAKELETLRRRIRRDQRQQQHDFDLVDAVVLSPRREEQPQQKSNPLVFDAEHSTSHAIFYNIYIPPSEESSSTKNTEKMDNALRIVQEQIAQVKASFALHHASSHDKKETKKQVVVPLFYNTIGHAMNATWMNELCSSSDNDNKDNSQRHFSLDCIFLNHYNNNTPVFEDVTLQRVLDYCQSPPPDDTNDVDDNDHRTVIYMHSKGSFNARDGSNDVWRRHSTNAVTSRECLLATTTTSTTTPTEGKKCNVCGLLFNPMPGMHFPGNFFTARCSYIKHLMPPSTFQQYMQQRVVPQALARRLRKTLDLNLYPALDPWMHGVDRWAFEWWIASHPYVVPCDVSIQTSIYPFKEAKQTTEDAATDPLTTFAWAMAPRFSYRDGNWDYTTGASRKFVMRKPERRRTEYALLAGHLFRWITIYNDNNHDSDEDESLMKSALSGRIVTAASNSSPAGSSLVVPPDDSWIWEW